MSRSLIIQEPSYTSLGLSYIPGYHQIFMEVGNYGGSRKTYQKQLQAGEEEKDDAENDTFSLLYRWVVFPVFSLNLGYSYENLSGFETQKTTVTVNYPMFKHFMSAGFQTLETIDSDGETVQRASSLRFSLTIRFFEL
ncbi:MAG: hypothetical protein HQM14_12540 [SAR324 cluster bacterium]|nr:hypothetical protein [SAR324 cluster bacterium]